ncbi:MAG: Sec-independent protein translocase protein TatB [Smithella sp.]|nr:Sec-independent protein translocase protein TatB [Smithella sp.]
MFGIGMQELLIIAVIALLIVGPKKLPDLAKSIGKGFSEFRRAADDVTEDIKETIKETDSIPAKEDWKDSLLMKKSDSEKNKTGSSD